MNIHLCINLHWLKWDDSWYASRYEDPVLQPCIISTSKRKLVCGRKHGRHKTYIQGILKQISTIHTVQVMSRRWDRRKKGGNFLKCTFTSSYIKVKPELTSVFFLRKSSLTFSLYFTATHFSRIYLWVVKALNSSRITLQSWLILNQHCTAESDLYHKFKFSFHLRGRPFPASTSPSTLNRTMWGQFVFSENRKHFSLLF